MEIAGIVEKHIVGQSSSGSPTLDLERPTRTTSSDSPRTPPGPVMPKTESEAERLVRGLTGGDQKEVSH